MKTHSLRFLRLTVAILSIVAVTLVFVDITGWCAARLSFLTKLQLVPALLSANAIAIIILAALTLLFGRLYCSVICPLGISQDAIAFLRRSFAKRAKRKAGIYRYTPENKVLRYGFLILFLLLVIAGCLTSMSFAGLLDPYSAYGRIVSQTLVPAWRAGAAAYGQHAAAGGNYIFDAEPMTTGYISLAIAVVAAITFIVVAVFAIRTGRGYCNTICPVGTILGFLSRYSLLKPVIDTDKCNGCGSCARHCKSQCIEAKKHSIDYSRCVVCMDCINSCKQGAISYRRRTKTDGAATEAHTVDGNRRSFLIGTAIVAGSAAASASEKIVDGGFAPLKDKHSRKDTTPVIPPGARSLRHFRGHCTACQLCVSQCPGHILKPSTTLDGFMQPRMVFTDSYCRPECTRCGEVCPAGAIWPIDAATKSSIKIGTARVDASLCISATNGESCGNCSRHCPVNAISMVANEEGRLRPVVNENACIGCGACEYHCPVGTVEQFASATAAIYVEGLKQHQTI